MMRMWKRNKKRAFTLIELLVVICIISLLAAILFPVFGRARENARRSSCQSNLKQIGLAFHQYAQDFDERLPTALSYVPGALSSWDQLVPPYLGFEVNTNVSPMILRCPSDSVPRKNGSCSATYSPKRIRSYSMPRRESGGVVTSVIGSKVIPDPLVPSAYYYPGRLLSEVPDASGTLLVVENVSSKNAFGDDPAAIVLGMAEQGAQVACAGPTLDPIHFDGWNYLFVDGHVKWLYPEATINGVAGGTGTASAPKGMWTITLGD